MNCPVCHTPMEARTRKGVLATVFSLFVGRGSARTVKHWCPKCRAEVSRPVAEQPPIIAIENFEDYRKSCIAQVSGMLKGKPLLGGFWTEQQQAQLDQLERFVRILDAMTVEDRLGIDPPDAAERERLVAASGTTPEAVEELFAEFAQVRAIHEQVRQKKVKVPLWVMIGPVGIVFPCLTAALFLELTGTAAALVSSLTYYFVCVIFVCLCLSRVKNAHRVVFSSPLRKALFLVVIPGVLAAVVFALVHEHVVNAGFERATVSAGFTVLSFLLLLVYSTISTKLMMWRLRRAAAAQKAAAESGEPAQTP